MASIEVAKTSVSYLENLFMDKMLELNKEYWKWQEREKVVSVAASINMPSEFINELKTYL